jgi:hypothetical protein
MKTTRIRSLAVGAFLVTVIAVSPVAAVDLTSLGITVLSTQPEGDRVVYELKDAKGTRLTVVGDKEVTEPQAKAVLYLRDALMGWKSMAAPSLRVTLSGPRAEALVVPSRYAYDGLDLVRYIPSGMQFYLDTILEYDFRMKVGSIFLRMKGQFFDEDQLGARVANAARDPIRFLERTDPEYLYRTLQEVTTALKGLESGGDNALQSLRDLVADYQALKAQKPLLEKKLGELDAGNAALTEDLQKLADDYAALKNEHDALRASHEELAAKHDELGAKHDELKAEVEKLAAANQALTSQAAAAAEATTKEIVALRASMLALHNTGFLRGPTPLDPAIVARAYGADDHYAALVISLTTATSIVVIPLYMFGFAWLGPRP